MKLYCIGRLQDGTVYCRAYEEEIVPLPLSSLTELPNAIPKRFYTVPHVVHHSPIGFEVGWRGQTAGTLDLALSILTDLFDEAGDMRRFFEDPFPLAPRAWSLHQPFKEYFLQRPVNVGEELRITSDQIEAWLALGANIEPTLLVASVAVCLDAGPHDFSIAVTGIAQDGGVAAYVLGPSPVQYDSLCSKCGIRQSAVPDSEIYRARKV